MALKIFFGNVYIEPVLKILNVDTQVGASSSTTHNLVSVPAGALLVVTTASELGGGVGATVSSFPSLTWTKRVDADNASSGGAEIFTAIFTAGGSIDITSDWGSWYQSSVVYVIVGFDNTFPGDLDIAGVQNAPSVSIDTIRDNSLIICVSNSWNAPDGSGGRTYRNLPVEEVLYNRDGTAASMFHYYYRVGAAGNYTVGIISPDDPFDGYGTAVLEIVTELSTTIYNESVSESLTLSDNVSTLLTLASDVVESVSLTDSQANFLDILESIIEILSFTDTIDTSIIVLISVTETINLIDNVVSQTSIDVNILELLSLTDSQNALKVLLDTISEVLSFSDAIFSIVTLNSSLTETFPLTDSVSSIVIYNVTIIESISLVDTPNAPNILSAIIQEVLSFTDSQFPTGDYNIIVNESLPLLDNLYIAAKMKFWNGTIWQDIDILVVKI